MVAATTVSVVGSYERPATSTSGSAAQPPTRVQPRGGVAPIGAAVAYTPETVPTRMIGEAVPLAGGSTRIAEGRHCDATSG
eukprot:1461390-Prymnesium_polylepis.3